jgi:hypothetical protein
VAVPSQLLLRVASACSSSSGSGAVQIAKHAKHLHESQVSLPSPRRWAAHEASIAPCSCPEPRPAPVLLPGPQRCSTSPVVPLDTDLYSVVLKLIPSKCLMHALPSALQAAVTSGTAPPLPVMETSGILLGWGAG